MSIKIGIYGYGNLAKGVELAVKANPDMRLLKKLEQKNNLFPWIGECL